LRQAELFSILDYLEFLGLTVYWILIELWSYNSNSYFVTCSNSWSSLAATIKLFISYLNVPFPTAFQEESFALVSVLEYPYPISVFCYSAVFEVYYDSQARFKVFVRQPGKLVKNFMYHIGTILMNAMTAPECLPALNGTCFGQRVGTALNLLLLP